MDEWLKNLKAGDKVIVSNRYDDMVRTVEKVTPTGLVRVDGTLYRDGYHNTGERWSYGTQLREATPEALESIRKKAVIAKANSLITGRLKLTYEQAEQIVKILEA